MIQEIAPHTLDNHWSRKNFQKGDYVLCFMDGKLALTKGCRLPQAESGDDSYLYLFDFDSRSCWLTPSPEENTVWIETGKLRGLGEGVALAGTTAWHLKRWYDSHRYCGCCGKPLHLGSEERSLVCPSCNHTIYPTIMPAIIAGVWDRDRLLMTRYTPSHSKHRGLALVAGFVEIGESAEETVKREILEEVGLQVKHIRYFASQPWGIAGDLLLGYFCQLDHPDDITLQRDELESAQWVKREDIDGNTDTVSLTGTMIRYFKENPQAFSY